MIAKFTFKYWIFSKNPPIMCTENKKITKMIKVEENIKNSVADPDPDP